MKTLCATAVVGGALLAAATPASADTGDLCAAPWQWNGPLALLHEDHASGYVSCNDDHAAGDHGISVLDDGCAMPWRWNGPLEIFTFDRPPSRAACDGPPAG